jgi:hypothetical protein
VSNWTTDVVAGVILGCVVAVVIQCGESWYSGGSADPRCAYQLNGYTEHHLIGHLQGDDRVSCRRWTPPSLGK